MNIAIIGGGITGLTAAYKLTKQGHKVIIFEKDTVLGGLAHGFRQRNWDWSLEKAYHHLFTNDDAIISLIKELRLEDKLIIKRPVTANLVPTFPSGSHWNSGQPSHNKQKIVQFDSPLDLLRYPYLDPISKIRTGAFLAFLKLNPDWIGVNPFWKPLESVTAKQLFTTVGGDHSWTNLWGPLMEGKFGTLTDTVAASWLWARIKKRTPNLCYIEGGFQTLIMALEKAIQKHNGTIYTHSVIQSIKRKKNCIYVNGRSDIYNSFLRVTFDRVLFTVPTPIALKICPDLTFGIGNLALKIPHLHAQTLILETDEPILRDVYWLNILDRTFPFLAVIAHTNFMDKAHYGNRHLTYFGNYLQEGHPYLAMTKGQLCKEFLPFIKRLHITSNLKIKNSNLRKKSLQFKVLSLHSFTGFYAQPVHQLHYSKLAPPMETPLKGIYLANLDSIYPWDRGTNYAVELGEKAAKLMDTVIT